MLLYDNIIFIGEIQTNNTPQLKEDFQTSISQNDSCEIFIELGGVSNTEAAAVAPVESIAKQNEKQSVILTIKESKGKVRKVAGTTQEKSKVSSGLRKSPVVPKQDLNIAPNLGATIAKPNVSGESDKITTHGSSDK